MKGRVQHLIDTDVDVLGQSSFWNCVNKNSRRRVWEKSSSHIRKFKSSLDGTRSVYGCFGNVLVVHVLGEAPTYTSLIIREIRHGTTHETKISLEMPLVRVQFCDEYEMADSKYLLVQELQKVTVYKIWLPYIDEPKTNKSRAAFGLTLLEMKYLRFDNPAQLIDIRGISGIVAIDLYLAVLSANKVFIYTTGEVSRVVSEKVAAIADMPTVSTLSTVIDASEQSAENRITTSTTELTLSLVHTIHMETLTRLRDKIINAICWSLINPHLIYLAGTEIWRYDTRRQILLGSLCNDKDASITAIDVLRSIPHILIFMSGSNQALNLVSITEPCKAPLASIRVPERTLWCQFYVDIVHYTAQENRHIYIHTTQKPSASKTFNDVFVLQLPSISSEGLKKHSTIIELDTDKITSSLRFLAKDENSRSVANESATLAISETSRACLRVNPFSFNIHSTSLSSPDFQAHRFLPFGAVQLIPVLEKLVNMYSYVHICPLTTTYEQLYRSAIRGIQTGAISNNRRSLQYPIHLQGIVKLLTAVYKALASSTRRRKQAKHFGLGALDAVGLRSFPRRAEADSQPTAISIPKPLCPCGLFKPDSGELYPAYFDHSDSLNTALYVPGGIPKNPVPVVYTAGDPFSKLYCGARQYEDAQLLQGKVYKNCSHVPGSCLHACGESRLLDYYETLPAARILSNAQPREFECQSADPGVVHVDSATFRLLLEHWPEPEPAGICLNVNYVPGIVDIEGSKEQAKPIVKARGRNSAIVTSAFDQIDVQSESD